MYCDWYDKNETGVDKWRPDGIKYRRICIGDRSGAGANEYSLTR